MNNSFDCAFSSTSRFGLVGRSVNRLVESGTEVSCVNGLNHAWSSVRTQLPDPSPARTPPVMMRFLFLAGPLVIRIVDPMTSEGRLGFSCELSPVMAVGVSEE